MHWPPWTEIRSFSATGMPSSGCRRSSGGVAFAAGGREPGIGGIGLLERGLPVDRQPGVQCVVVALGAARWASASSRERSSPDRSRAAISWAWRRLRLVMRDGYSPPPRIAGTTMNSPSVLGGVPEDVLDRQRLAGDVVAQDVLELDRLGGRGDVVRVQPAEDLVLVDDMVQLALEATELLVGQPETGQIRDVLDVGSGQGGHGPMIAERPEAASGRGRASVGAWVRAPVRTDGAQLHDEPAPALEDRERRSRAWDRCRKSELGPAHRLRRRRRNARSTVIVRVAWRSHRSGVAKRGDPGHAATRPRRPSSTEDERVGGSISQLDGHGQSR